MANGAPDDGADGLPAVAVLDDGSGAIGVSEVRVTPLQECDQDREEVLASVGEAVPKPGPGAGHTVGHAGQQAAVDQGLQPGGEQVPRHAEPGLEIGKPAGAVIRLA